MSGIVLVGSKSWGGTVLCELSTVLNILQMLPLQNDEINFHFFPVKRLWYTHHGVVFIHLYLTVTRVVQKTCRAWKWRAEPYLSAAKGGRRQGSMEKRKTALPVPVLILKSSSQ